MEESSVIVFPSNVKGIVTAPAGKSMMQRVLLLALLHDGKTYISNPGKSDDDMNMARIVESLGAVIDKNSDTWIVTGAGKLKHVDSVNCGESGLALRMTVPVLALGNNEVMVNGSGTLKNRKHQFPTDVFSQLNISLTQSENGLPLFVKGPIKPCDVTIRANESSQYLTGLLFALGASIKENITINIIDPVSLPYIELTIQMMRDFGYECECSKRDVIILSPPKDPPKDIVIHIEGDWSGGSFLILAGALSGDLTIWGLYEHSIQADRRILEVLRQTETDFSFERDKLIIYKNEQIKPFHFDATDCPDLFPALSVLASYAIGKSTIKGVHRLYNKESNRALAIVENLASIGVQICIHDDEMIIEGAGKVSGGVVQSFNDHRIMMAMACAALRAESSIEISNPMCINKSYPNFFTHLRNLGAKFHSTTNLFSS